MWDKKQHPTFFSEQFDRLVPTNDKFRIIKETIDFTFINEMARPFYGDVGPLGYVPDKLFRMLVVMYLENIPSERKLEERLKRDIVYRFFCDLDIMDDIPDHATFSVFRSRLGDELFREIFEKLLDMIFALGFARPKHISIDSTSVIADCAPPRKTKKQENRDDDDNESSSLEKQPSDSDARWGVKGGKSTHFGYKLHVIVGSEKGLILGVKTTAANVADVEAAKALLPLTLETHDLNPSHLAADKAYNGNDISKELEAREIKAVIPTKGGGPKMREGFSKDDFSFDGATLICPAGEAMKRYDLKNGAVLFTGVDCANCRQRSLCTKADVRRVQLDPGWQRRIRAAQWQKTAEFKELYNQRSSVERVNSEAKRQHGLSRARYRGLEKVAIQGFLTGIVINLKRAAVFIASKAPPKATTALSG